jgi:hypothetical protein
MGQLLEQIQSMFPDYAYEAVLQAQEQDYLNSILETQLTPEEEEAQLLGLTVAQMNAKTEDMLDSILKSQGENETGFVNESARIAAEGILKGKIAQAGVTDPAAQEAALKSAMESLEGGASGLEAVKAAAGGAQDYVEELLKTAKTIIDKGYDATIGKLPEILTPEGILADIVSGNVTGVFEIGETGAPLPNATSPIFGGTVGTVGGGTNVGIMTTGNAVLDAVIRAAEGGVDAGDIESVVGAVISANTGIPTDVVNAGIGGAKSAIEAAKTVVGSSVTGNGDGDGADDTTNIAINSGAVTTRTCEDGSLVGVNDLCPEDLTTITGGDGTGTSTVDPSATNVPLGGVTATTTRTCNDGSVVDITEACPEDTTVTTRTCNSGSVVGINEACPEDLDDPCDSPKYAKLNPVECGGVTDREIIDDDLVAKDECIDCTCPEYALANPEECRTIVDECIDCTCPEYALANPEECRTIVDECIDCTCPEYALANPEECRTIVDECIDCTCPEYALANPEECRTIVDECIDCTCPEYALANPEECRTIVDECIDCTCPEYALANPEECRIIVDECIDCTCPEYALANPEECRTIVDECIDCTCPEYALANPEECRTIVDECIDCTCPEYALANPEECRIIVDECIDCTCPEYALANPEECRIIVDECIDCTCPEYALANPEECRIIVDECIDCTCPEYALANPEECRIIVDECIDCTCPEYALANPEECPPVNLCDDPVVCCPNPAKCRPEILVIRVTTQLMQHQDRVSAGL